MRTVVYQLFVRHFSNFATGGEPWGSKTVNGCGTFNGVTDAALQALAQMGITHLWLTGVLRHATQTAYEGLPADPACTVKGIAGSPYAVTDFYDVDPDLAVNPAERMAEFRALLQRIRRWGMVPMLDFIPNHVARNYRSTVRPEMSFGAGDDTSRFCAWDNSFYYMEPQNSDWWLNLPQGEFTPERGHGRVTGNNAAVWAPSEFDWYETVKLNYGCDYRQGPAAANALPSCLTPAAQVPRTWRLMDDVIAYWQGMGVGGFRCDMAHMVPLPFWRWLLVNSRLRDASAFFMAEGYDDHMSLAGCAVQNGLLGAGFNGVYDGAAYERLRNTVAGHAWCNDWDALNHAHLPQFYGGVRYIENHDERRMASPQFTERGSAEAVMPAAMALQYTATCGPVLVYNGQECAERADGPGGFGGDNGRTSIFDYTNLPRLQHWTNGGAYDGALLTPQEKQLRDFTAALLPLLQHPALSKGVFYGLNWSNQQTAGFGRAAGDAVSGRSLYAFLRHYRKAKATVLVICNLSAEPAATSVHIPRNAQEWAGKKPGRYSFRNLLDPAAPAVEADDEQLCTTGLPIQVAPGGALLLEWS